MEIINFPACTDSLAGDIFWTVLVSLTVGMLFHGLLTKFKTPARVSGLLTFLIVLCLAAICFWFILWQPFTGVSIDNKIVRLHHLWPFPTVEIDGATINGVSKKATLQSQKYGRQWKRLLHIKTSDGTEYESVFVCIDSKKVGPTYYSAIFTKLSDPIEAAEEMVETAAVESKLTSPQAKNIDPQIYGELLVRRLRVAWKAAFKKKTNKIDRQKGFSELDRYLKLIQNAFGDTHYAAGIVYRFIGSAHGYNGDLNAARRNFQRADECFHNFDKAWYAVNERIYPEGLSLSDFEHPDPNKPNAPMSATDY